jgi:hypothetical protein
MSEWRQKGYVQDSDDEEEESQVESQGSRRNGTSQGRVERVDNFRKPDKVHGRGGNDIAKTTEVNDQRTNDELGSVQKVEKVEPPSPITRVLSPRRPTASPLTPSATFDLRRDPTESPDPLQNSPQLKAFKTNQAVSSQLLGSPRFASESPSSTPREQTNPTTVSQAIGGSSPRPNAPISSNTRANATTNILGAFGVQPLSDASDDDDLSDPPTDLESPEAGYTVAQPHRRTAVQVVIPSSTALQRHVLEQESGREFRQRKPIQLHPYALEGELYRREVQSRGLKPVPRPRSPEPRVALQETETQEKDFDPNETPDSSPPEVEIAVSTPVISTSHAYRSLGSLKRPCIPNPARRRLPSTQLQLPLTAKRRKPNLPLTQGGTEPMNISENDTRRRDIWSVPPNSPPYSSSPLLNGALSVRRLGINLNPATTPAPNLPTPSTSSVILENHPPLPESDIEDVSRSATQPGNGLRRPTRTVLSDRSSSASDSSSEAEQSDSDLRKVGKKIKGVLPASWLRFDQQAQGRRKARERERARQVASLSPEPSEPQRGVAQRVLKRIGTGRRSTASSTPTRNVVIISDGSDDEHDQHHHLHDHDLQTSVEDAAAMAAAFDNRYAADDSDNMEDDRLHLFTLRGSGTKRKKQTKLTDMLGKAKRLKTSSNTAKKSHARSSGRRQHTWSSGTHRTSPPALSIVDLDLSSSQGGTVPLFLRLAKRQALRRPDLARQSPQTKQIRLHNARDTEDANVTLQQWRKGVLQAKVNVASQPHKAGRSPLTNKVDNQQYAWERAQIEDIPNKERNTIPKATSSRVRDQHLTRMPSALDLFQRNLITKSSHRTKRTPRLNQVLQRSVHGAPPQPRTGQLKGDEDSLGGSHTRVAFEKGLRHADNQPPALSSSRYAYMNPQLARFLADDDAALPPLPSANDIGEEGTRNTATPVVPSRKKLIRKRLRVQRIDVDAREYRQPSEPTAQEVFDQEVSARDKDEFQENNPNVLQGLAPCGVRYPTTFDVSSLQADTYFHSSTLIGSEELRHAFSIAQLGGRDLDEPAGYCSVTHESTVVRCGPWNDETSSALYDIVRDTAAPLDPDSICLEENVATIQEESLKTQRVFLRSLINYISTYLSFSDPVDRKGFVSRIHQMLSSLFDRISVLHVASTHVASAAGLARSSFQVMTYLLVLSVQLYRIGKDTVVDSGILTEMQELISKLAKDTIAYIVREGISELSTFLELNKRHAIRLKGIQENDALVEGTVICMHALENAHMPALNFWDIVSHELSLTTSSATHIGSFESAWAALFTLVPLNELDISGIPTRERREGFSLDNWSYVSDMLRRLFDMYPATYKKHGSSLNDYVRANLARCHRLIKYWHWQRPEQMLNVTFDFFGRNGLKPLRRESASGSVAFLDHTLAEAPLHLEPNECSFHIALKCLVLGLRGMRRTYIEKKIRSFVFRTIPNHGRSYPKDQPLDGDSLAALRNHHDLLCTLYWAAPPSCRPRLELIRSLVSHESSHLEACRVNVRAWAKLTTFQLWINEPYISTMPFAVWHKDIMHQTLKQYRLARTEADDYLKSGTLDGTTDISAVMVRRAMERNQEQVIATLRDCIAGMRRATTSATDQAVLDTFLVDSDIVHLLELPHLEDRRLVNVIRDTLLLLQEHIKRQRDALSSKESQQASEDSQDYGDFPDMDDLDILELQSTEIAPQHASLDFIQTPLWHLLSNAFGAEISPDHDLLMDCVDTWILVADVQVASNTRSWSYYLDSFSQVSWQQLRQTEQARKFGPYFLACLIDRDRTAYEQHRQEFNTSLLLSLVDRESMLRFQHRLLHAIVRADSSNPLIKNLPFFYDQNNDAWDITSDTLRIRRLPLISSILSNMRDDLHVTASESPTTVFEVRRMYAAMLKEFMARMRTNYLQLQQGTKVTGAYVEFVQKVVQFLKQYSGDICPVISFFTDSVAFPLPSADPTYVVGRLCGYASKATEPGTAKQLSVFIQTVTQQAAADNQQWYLTNQLTTALCSEESPAADRATLRAVLLQGIFPAYLESAFSSSTAFLIARPILQSLQPILDTMMFDLRITQSQSVSSILNSIFVVSHAFIRATVQLRKGAFFLEQPHILSALTSMFEIVGATFPVLEYVCNRTNTSSHYIKPPLVGYMRELGEFVVAALDELESYALPDYEGDAHTMALSGQHQSLIVFGKKGLGDSMKMNWSESGGVIWFGQGHAKREIIFEIGSVEEERARLATAIGAFSSALQKVFGEEDSLGIGGASMADDIVV